MSLEWFLARGGISITQEDTSLCVRLCQRPYGGGGYYKSLHIVEILRVHQLKFVGSFFIRHKLGTQESCRDLAWHTREL
jgi:hypothetical protein